MAYPTDIPGFRTALLAWSAPTGLDTAAADAVTAAQSQASVVVQAVSVLDALASHVSSLDTAGLELLAGAAHLVAVNSWFGKAEAALTARDAALAALAP